MPKISIVIPCYNSFRLIDRCLDSLENQTFKDFEVIFVDDCSTDGTYDKLLSYKNNSKCNISVLKNEKNSGPGMARNYALKHVKGDYITFVDSDDYLENNAFKKIMLAINDTDADCVIHDFYFDKNNRKSIGKSITNAKKGYISKRFALIYLDGSTMCKVYKAHIILDNGVIFPDAKLSEDMVFNKLAISYCNKIYYYNVPLYNYVQHRASLLHSNAAKHEAEKIAFSAYQLIQERLSNKYSYEVEAITLLSLLYPTLIYMVETKSKTNDLVKHISMWEQIYPNFYKHTERKNFKRVVKICLFFAEMRMFFCLRLLVIIRKIGRTIINMH